MSLEYVTQRIGYMVITFWISITIVFLLFRLLPGDPTHVLLNPLSAPETRAQLIRELGLDRSLWEQYWVYLRDLLSGDLGVSYFHGVSVLSLIPHHFANSFILAFSIFVLAYGLGTLVGVVLAWGRGRWWESAANVILLLLRGSPPFWTAILLVMLFSVVLEWTPIAGMASLGQQAKGLAVYLSWDFLHHLILPVVTGTVYAMALPLLLARNTTLDILGEEYIVLARAKGLSETAVIFRHAARNALLPVVAESALFIGWAMGGLVTVEFVFSWPGLGWVLVTALEGRDYPLAQGAFLCIVLLILLLYFISDLVSTKLDPRIQFG
jgi:peptide/nickel transport system permease protein